MLIGDLVQLRLVEEEDLGRLVCWRNTPRIWAGFFNKFPLSLGAQYAWYAELSRSATRKLFMICTADTGVAVGAAGLDNIDFANGAAELGGVLIGDETSLGKGYAKAAVNLLLDYCFLRLNINRVDLRVYAHNKRAIGLYCACGFQEDGVLREAQYEGGAYRDIMIMSILAREFRQTRSVANESQSGVDDSET